MAKIDLNDYLEKLAEPEDRETVANRAYQRELFEQYVTKDGNFPEQRAQLLEDFRAGKELTGPKGLRRKLGAFDLEYFGRAYLAHYFVRPSPKREVVGCTWSARRPSSTASWTGYGGRAC